MSGPELFLIAFGAVLALIGIVVFFVLAWFRRTGGGRNEVQLGPVKFSLSNASLVIFVGGAVVMALPFVLPIASDVSNRTPTPTDAALVSPLRGKTVYIFISSEFQRNDADALLRRLGDNSAKVYGVENLVKNIKVTAENADQSFPEANMAIRYFYLNDLEAAKSIKGLSQRNTVALDDHTEDPIKNPEGILEVWYPWSKK